MNPLRALLRPGHVSLFNVERRVGRSWLHELAYAGLHDGPAALVELDHDGHQAVPPEPEGVVLVCDGDHGFNPYQLAELQIERGHPAGYGAKRVLIKRAMTPFQWDSILTKQLPAKLLECEPTLVVVSPMERLLLTDELTDWEQVDHTRKALETLRQEAMMHHVPIVLLQDFRRTFHQHLDVAKQFLAAIDRRDRYELRQQGGAWRVTWGEGATKRTYTYQPVPPRTDQPTLWHFDPAARPKDACPIPLEVVRAAVRRRPKRSASAVRAAIQRSMTP